MPLDGYSDKTCLADTDFNGILAVVINNKQFQRKISVNLGLVPNIFTEARIIGREIRHSANHLLRSVDLMKYIDDLIALLSDPAYLVADVKANDAVGKLKQLKTNKLTIHADDITNVLNESIKTTFDEQQKALLRDIQTHFKNHKTDSVEAIDKKVQESVDKLLAEVKAQIERGKDELNAEKEKGKTELNLQSKTDKDHLQRNLEQGTDVLKTYTKKGKGELQAELEQGTDVLKSYTKKVKDEIQTHLEQGKYVLNIYTKKGKDELQAHLEQGTDELNTYTKQSTDELQAQLEQGLDALNTYTNTGKDELQTQIEQGKHVLNTHITATDIALNAQTKTINKLGESIVLYTRTIDNLKHEGIEELQEVTKTGKQELEVQSKLASEKINRSTDCATAKKTQSRVWDKITFKKFRLRSEFKAELIGFYNQKESMIPASPLVEDFAVPLTKLYVQPPMSAFIRPIAFGQGNKPSEKKRISSYRELFLNDENVPYKDIYVEANAGYGKTSFTQKLAMTWCQAHRPNKSMKSKFNEEDVDTLKRFEFLFLLHLRDFQSDKCNLDELILKFVARNLHNNEQYSEQFIAKIIQKKTCLVIIDGLDEWVHPETCTRTPGIPHNKYHGNCTVLTTTRPWKLSTIGLPPNLIDRHLEISELDDITSKELELNAVKLLSENSGTQLPDLTDFDRKVSSVKLGDIRLIPYILLQLICIWFDGLSIGKSKCETYSNTIELTLQRGLNKKNVPTLSTGNEERNVIVPECMRHNALCNQYKDLLLKLGNLAFYALFQKIKESSLVIESTTVLEFLTEQELKFCLKIGLLSQSKDSSKVSVKRYQVVFQHKSVQEFMAALYITSEWNNATIKSTILLVCSSLSRILEMENLIFFVCGMNPAVYTCISGELHKIVDHDDVTCRYRTYVYIDDDAMRSMESYQYRTDMYVSYSDRNDDARRTMESYQYMQVQCLQESVKNGNNSCFIQLYDILDRKYSRLTEDDLTTLKTIINSKGHVKSLLLSDPDQITAFMQSLKPGVFTSLETLRIEDCYKEPVWLANILTESARTLKCLTLSLRYRDISLPDISITALTGLICLQSLYLDNVHMTHNNLKCLYDYISRTTTLTQLRLEDILCSDHRRPYHRNCDFTLDLHRLSELKMLHLIVPCRELHVNPACLEKLKFRRQWGEKMTAKASVTLWQDLRAAPALSSLTLWRMSACQEMIQTIPTLTQLKVLELLGIDMTDVIPRVSHAITHLERVHLWDVAMSFSSWIELFLSIGQLPRSITVTLAYITMTSQEWRDLLHSVGQLQHPVTVKLDTCDGPSSREWQAIVYAINSTSTSLLLHDLSIGMFGASVTLKNNTV